MAWPCISRVCCLARFWNQFDKSDLSVPLTIQNYSDIPDHEVRSITKQVSASERAPGNKYATPDPRGPSHAPRDGPGTRGSLKARTEQSYKPREEYHPPGVPFNSVTQYKQDFKPWPIPRKENFPWISNGGSRADSAPDSPENGYHSQAHPGEGEERGRGQRGTDPQGVEESKTSSYRQEYRQWTGVRPAKSVRKNPLTQYSSPGTEATNVPRETSYQAAYSGDVPSIGLHHKEQNITSAAPNVHPAGGPQHIPTALPAGGSPTSSSLHLSEAEDHLVRTKFPPNSSALFQSGPRVFNI
ncbi:hypothetical protein CesoFtcFv8_014977 [Champsocephalus esox]|uniref:MAP6 domain-containing protein 1 n=2 Tax=Champsocephalus TaxID=52236 RepID=A0AAN8D9P4_CHAGU|nr:hypothetical protein CesoFtcFv8_014977 [Champsocephalus esox]KAK5919451.1 hypothetical protein CgunFtcFv8_023344 [Champsocephalus gunnari]